MARKLAAGVLSTGPSGNGKTTFFQLMADLLRPKHGAQIVACIDMSKILMRWGMNQTSQLGVELRDHFHLIGEGKLLPDWLVIKTFTSWYADVVSAPEKDHLQVLLLSGAPRSVEQLALLEMFQKVMAINIHATREQSDAAILERLTLAGDTKRPDDLGGQLIADQRWLEYEQCTMPAISRLNGKGFHLDRSEPLTTRLRKTLEHMEKTGGPVPLALVQTGINRLNTHNHPIHEAIRKIESPRIMHDPRQQIPAFA